MPRTRGGRRYVHVGIIGHTIYVLQLIASNDRINAGDVAQKSTGNCDAQFTNFVTMLFTFVICVCTNLNSREKPNSLTRWL